MERSSSVIEWLQDGVTCRFDPVGHHYFYGDEEKPSVTNALKKSGFGAELENAPRHFVERAQERGAYVDACLRLLESEQLDKPKVHKDCAGYIAGYEAWKLEKEFVSLGWGVPRIGEYEGLKFGMTEDTYGSLAGTPVLVDIKCTAVVPRSVGPQLAGYVSGKNEFGIMRYAVQLFPDGTYRPYLYESESDFDAWYCALYMAHWEPSKKLTARRKIKK